VLWLGWPYRPRVFRCRSRGLLERLRPLSERSKKSRPSPLGGPGPSGRRGLCIRAAAPHFARPCRECPLFGVALDTVMMSQERLAVCRAGEGPRVSSQARCRMRVAKTPLGTGKLRHDATGEAGPPASVGSQGKARRSSRSDGAPAVGLRPTRAGAPRRASRRHQMIRITAIRLAGARDMSTSRMCGGAAHPLLRARARAGELSTG